MNKLKLPLVFAFALTLTIIGCRSNPVYNVQGAPITIAGKHSSKDIEKSVIRAGAVLGWRFKTIKKGHMEGTLTLRKHVAVIDLTFNDKEYNITYKSSQNLDYDGTNIHGNYNGWIQNLDRSIQAQFQTF